MDESPRFDDAQLAEILRRASTETPAEGTAAAPAAQRAGLTLPQIEAIAAEAGIAPEAVRRAAASVARGDHLPSTVTREFGLPVAVARTVTLPRMLEEGEWQSLVLELQETFAARGRERQDGRQREWRNGNLRAVLEPTAAGARLRLSTRKGDAAQLTRLAGLGATLAAIFAALGLGMTDGAVLGASVGLLGLSALALLRNLLVLPRWARTRAAQMQGLGERLAALVDLSPALPPGAAPDRLPPAPARPVDEPPPA